MSVTINNNLNPFKKNDRVSVNDKSSFLYNKKGTVIRTFDGSTEVALDKTVSIVIWFTRLKKLQRKK